MNEAYVSTPLIWPSSLSGFDRNGLALILLTLPASMRRAEARLHARTALYEISEQLLGHPAIGLREGPMGPELPGVGISISYSGRLALIGLSNSRKLGVDIVQVEHFPEIGALSRLYLPDAARRAVLDAPAESRHEAFALAWAQTEACCKCLGLPLTEIDGARELAYAACKLPDCGQIDGYRMAVALGADDVSREAGFIA